MMNKMLRYSNSIKGLTKVHIGYIIFNLLAILLSLGYTFSFQYLIDEFSKQAPMINNAIIAAGVAIVFVILYIFDYYFIGRSTVVAKKLIREDIRNKVEKTILFNEYQDTVSSELVVHKIVLDGESLANRLSYLFPEMLVKVFEVLTFGIFLFLLNWILAIIFYSIVLLLLTLNVIISISLETLQRDASIEGIRHEEVFKDMYENFLTIKLYNAKSFILKKYHDSYEKRMKPLFKLDLRYGLLDVVWTMTGVILPYINLFVGFYLSVNKILPLTTGEVISFYMLAQMATGTIGVIPSLFKDFVGSKADYFVLSEYLNPNKSLDESRNIALTNLKVDINSFSFNSSNKLLENIHFEVNPREVVLIKGESGKGKSTILNLILARYSLPDGLITLGNKDVQTLDKNILYSSFSLDKQNPVIFNGTIKENILFDDNVNNDFLSECLQLSQLNEVTHEKGLDYKLTKENKGLSGGQIQRISLCRTLLNGGSIILMDEPTSALDKKTSIDVIKGIRDYSNKTSSAFLIVTHSDLFDCIADKIIEIK